MVPEPESTAGVIELVFLSITLFCALYAVLDFRVGLYIAIFLDVFRDPVRKFSDSQSIVLTIAAVAVWGGVFLGAWVNQRRLILWSVHNYTDLTRFLQCLVGAMIPGAIMAMILYDRGYLLAIVGSASYLAPIAGLGIGLAFLREPREIYRLLVFFCIVNTFTLTGTLLEHAGFEHVTLGGLADTEWIRYREGYTVDLISGFYRSPDIMGLHAAHVLVFAIMLMRSSLSRYNVFWMGMAIHAAYCLLLCGRRKMIGIPLAFIAIIVLLEFWRSRGIGSARIYNLLMLSLCIVVAICIAFMFTDTDDYSQYAATTVSEGGERLQDNVIQGVMTTLNQSGFLGDGLGVATQGAHYLNIRSARAWQEDGISRLFKELGIVGVVLLTLSGICLLLTTRRSAKALPLNSTYWTIQSGLLAVVAGDAASFVVSHQHFSGDPGMAAFVVTLLGIALSLPLLVYRLQQRDKAVAL